MPYEEFRSYRRYGEKPVAGTAAAMGATNPGCKQSRHEVGGPGGDRRQNNGEPATRGTHGLLTTSTTHKNV